MLGDRVAQGVWRGGAAQGVRLKGWAAQGHGGGGAWSRGLQEGCSAQRVGRGSAGLQAGARSHVRCLGVVGGAAAARMACMVWGLGMLGGSR